MSKRIAYLTHMRLPTEKAYGVQMANTINGLSANGNEVSLVTTYNQNPIKDGFFKYYGLTEDCVDIKVFPALRIFRNTQIGFWINMLTFSLTCSVHVLIGKYNFLFSREPFPLMFFGLLGKKTLYEMHDFPEKNLWFHKLICFSVSHIAVTNEWARVNCIKKLGLPEKKILLIPNGYDEKRFARSIGKKSARNDLGIDKDAKVVLYSGHLYEWKGADIIYEVAKKLPGIDFVFVGGNNEEKERIVGNEKLPNTKFFAHQNPTLIPTFLATADLLVLPNVPINSHSIYSTSPIKLFEYMASRRPIIASRLPSIESLVSEKEVVFAEPGDVRSWTEAIESTLNSMNSFENMVNESASSVEVYGWRNRAKKILKHIS